MNRSERTYHGVWGGLENMVDSIRQSFDQFFYGKKVTGDVDMFHPQDWQKEQGGVHGQTQGQERESNAQAFDRMYVMEARQEAAREEMHHDQNKEMEVER